MSESTDGKCGWMSAEPIPGYPGYRISKSGDLWSSRTTGKHSFKKQMEILGRVTLAKRLSCQGLNAVEIAKKIGVGHSQSLRYIHYAEKTPVPVVWRRLEGTVNSRGYRVVSLANPDCLRKIKTVHELVLLTYVGPRPKCLCGCHGDDNKLNNNLENLRWDTHYENHQDAKRNGKKSRGVSHHNSKLNPDKVRAIRSLLSQGVPERKIAAKFGTSRNPIRDIKQGITWREVQ